jgi:hypothetical protein
MVIWAAGVTALLSSTHANAMIQFDFFNLGRVPGYAQMSPRDINESGHIVGTVFNFGPGTPLGFDVKMTGGLNTDTNFQPFAINGTGIMAGAGTATLVGQRRLPNGTIENLGPGPGRAINNAGVIVGTDFGFGNIVQSYTWKPQGGYQTFGSSADRFVAEGINDNGKVVGIRYFNTANRRAAYWSQTTGFVDLAQNGNAFAVNAAGMVAGQGRSNNFDVAAIWQADGTQIIVGDLPGGTTLSLLRDINVKGAAVGYGSSAQGLRAVYWTQASGLTDLNTLTNLPVGWTLRDAVAINNRGQITGTAVNAGVNYLFRLDPVGLGSAIPEPATWAMLIAGFGLVGASLRRRRSALV